MRTERLDSKRQEFDERYPEEVEPVGIDERDHPAGIGGDPRVYDTKDVTFLSVMELKYEDSCWQCVWTPERGSVWYSPEGMEYEPTSDGLGWIPVQRKLDKKVDRWLRDKPDRKAEQAKEEEARKEAAGKALSRAFQNTSHYLGCKDYV
jgi:hypothetical protein